MGCSYRQTVHHVIGDSKQFTVCELGELIFIGGNLCLVDDIPDFSRSRSAGTILGVITIIYSAMAQYV